MLKLSGPYMATLDVHGMTCAVCVSRVEKAISSVEGVKSVSVNLATGIANFNGEADIDDVISAIDNSGYVGSKQINFFEKWNSEKKDSIKELKLALLSLLYSLLAMYLIMTAEGNHTFFGIFSMSVVLIMNRNVVIKGFRSLLNGLNMYTLVLLAFLSALIWSLLYIEEAMWEATFIVVAFVGFGDALESFAKVSATSSFAELSSLISKGEIDIGDELTVNAGMVVPVDGIVLSGKTDIEQSAITGESMPVSITSGNSVWAGSIVIDGSIVIRATSSSGTSRIDEVIRLVETAQNQKANIQKTVDRIANFFVPVVVTLAVITFLYWSPERGTQPALMMAITVMIIACPCAMGLATPIALFVGTSVGAKHGILLKGHRALEAASKIETVVLDKTGTLTTGEFEVVADNEECLKIAASLENHTSHPIATAIVKSCPEFYEATNVTTIPGWGVKGMIDGKPYSVGKGEGRISVMQEDTLVGNIQITDKIRDDAVHATKFLPNVILSSGDNEAEVSRVANELGIDDARSNQSPEEKLALIRGLSNVAMVGDGINDSAALAAADLGIAVSSSTGIADISSDIVLTREGVMATVDALNLATKTRTNIRQNLVWAFGYNLLAIPVAMGVLYRSNDFLLPPWAAAAAMSLSSMCVILNSIRLRWSFERGLIRTEHGSTTTTR